VLGFSVLYVDYGEFIGTMVDPSSEKGFRDTGTFFPNAFSVGVGYAKALTDRFQVGGQVKYVSQRLGSSVLPVGEVRQGVTRKVENTVDVLAFDFGTLYHTGLKSLVFGMTVRNFSEEVKYQQEGFQLPLTFKMGLSMDVMDFFFEKSPDHSLLISVDAIHPRDYTEQINVGGEYVFRGIFALRAGYKYNYDEQGLTAGFGLEKGLGQLQFGLDYAYTPFGVFDQVQRFSARLSF